MFSKDKVIVGSGQPQGSVRKETIALSGTMQKSVPNLRLSPLHLQHIRNRKMLDVVGRGIRTRLQKNRFQIFDVIGRGTRTRLKSDRSQIVDVVRRGNRTRIQVPHF